MRRICALSLACLLVVGLLVPQATFAAKHAVIYSGTSSDSDAMNMDLMLRGAGWARELLKTSQSSSAAMKPYHGHFTHGRNDDMVEAADDADLLYYSGHGGWQAELMIFQGGLLGPQYHPDENVSPDVACNNDAPWEVGIGWQSPGVNESRWDTELEWVILASCEQLNTTQLDAYAGQSAAKTWARTLLGSPNRAHSIMGYDDSAPTIGDDDVATDFCNNSLYLGYSVLDSWRRANEANVDRNWAYVSHYANRGDYMPGVGSGPTADTPANSEYRIDLLSKERGTWGTILDDDGGEVIGSLTPFESWLASAVTPIATIGADFLVPTVGLPGRINAGSTVFNIEATPRGSDLRAREVTVSGASSMSQLMLGATITDVTPSSSRQVPLSVLSRIETDRQGLNGNESVTVMTNGVTVYNSERGLQHAPVAFSKDEAVRRVREYLESNGEMPADAVLAEVRQISMTTLDFEGAATEAARPVEYEVRFGQRVGQGYVDGSVAGLRVCIDSQGVREVYKKWFAVDASVGTAVVRSDPGVALARAAADAASSFDLPPAMTVKRMNTVLFPQQRNGEWRLVPAWRLEFADGSTLYADVTSGEIMKDEKGEGR